MLVFKGRRLFPGDPSQLTALALRGDEVFIPHPGGGDGIKGNKPQQLLGSQVLARWVLFLPAVSEERGRGHPELTGSVSLCRVPLTWGVICCCMPARMLMPTGELAANWLRIACRFWWISWRGRNGQKKKKTSQESSQKYGCHSNVASRPPSGLPKSPAGHRGRFLPAAGPAAAAAAEAAAGWGRWGAG